MFTTVLALLATQFSVADEKSLRQAVALHASFDETVRADAGGGQLDLDTRFTVDPKRNLFRFEKGINPKIFRVAKGKGIAGGALEATAALPDSGRIFFPAKGNIAFKKGGWSGAVSLWINTDPNKSLKTPFCDPVQITQKGANNGGLWFDFNNTKPRRDLRLGAFSAIPAGQKGIGEDDPQAPMVKVPGIDFKVGEWHHVALTWDNLDTGKPNGRASLYIDGKHIGTVKDRAITMDWDIEKTGIYVAVNYIGLLDEFAVFNRSLTAEEVRLLHQQPNVLTGLKKQ